MFVVDLGFSGAKWLHGEDRGTVRSCFRQSRDGLSFQGDRYLVGERALLETGSRYLRTVEELVEMYPLFVSACSAAAGVSRDDVLVVGLPYDYWRDAKDSESPSNPIRVLKGSLRIIGDSASGTGPSGTGASGTGALEFGRVAVFPQGLGGIKAYLAMKAGASGNILGVDIGFNTVIYALYSCAQGEMLAGKTFYRKGVCDMAVNGLIPRIKGYLHGVTVTPLEIDYAMQAGALQVGFDKVDITPEAGEAARAYVNDLFSLVTGDIKASHGRGVTFDTVLFFGGGARLLDGKVEASKVKVVVMEDPEYANAIGFRARAEEMIAGDARK